AGERVMLSGRSGSGKSSLLRALGGLWPHGSGQIRLPAEPILFLPQRPYLPIGTLREAMSYPQSADHYSPERFADA
ncbi:ABC transporter ATP-binding protein, partial [Pseudomonas syringae pv. actinidiae ICMP 18804]